MIKISGKIFDAVEDKTFAVLGMGRISKKMGNKIWRLGTYDNEKF